MCAMVLLCPRHHTAHHAGIYTIRIHHGIPWIRPPHWHHPDRPWLRNTEHLHQPLPLFLPRARERLADAGRRAQSRASQPGAAAAPAVTPSGDGQGPSRGGSAARRSK